MNGIYYKRGLLFFSGTKLNYVYFIKKGKIYKYSKIPYRSHNAQPFKKGVLLNNTHLEMWYLIKIYKEMLLKNFRLLIEIKEFKKVPTYLMIRQDKHLVEAYLLQMIIWFWLYHYINWMQKTFKTIYIIIHGHKKYNSVIGNMAFLI